MLHCYLLYVCTCRELKGENAALRKQMETVMQEKENLDDKLRCIHNYYDILYIRSMYVCYSFLFMEIIMHECVHYL